MNPPRRLDPMTRFSTFAMLYLLAIYLEMAEAWTYPVATFGGLLFLAWMLWRGVTPGRVFLFLIANTAHFLFYEFPDVPNHVNIALYCNILLMCGIVWAWTHRQRFPTDDDVYDLVRPMLQVSLVLIYAMAGFHKLNADYLDPAVSCTRTFLVYLGTVTKTRLFGVPGVLYLSAGILAGSFLLLARSRWRRHMPIAGTLLAAVVFTITVASLVRPAPGFDSPASLTGILVMSAMVICWELGGGMALTVPRFQAAILAFSWIMHATFSLMRLSDFGALALALLFTFVPRNWFDLLAVPVRLPGTRMTVSRLQLYFGLCLVTGIANLHGPVLVGLLFNAAALVFIWPLLARAVGTKPLPVWAGVPLSSPTTPRWLYLFPVVLVFHGLTGYLGLRTAGNFSMFSNLRTEGERSNHFLLGGNPLKIWDYQEDVVEITRIDENRAQSDVTGHPLGGYRVPVVEFRKLIHAWAEAGTALPVTFLYQGRVFESPDITNEPDWRVERPDWKMRLMDFRMIQPEGPNQCRW